MAKVTVNGVKYKVTENMGYSHDRGQYAKFVETPEGERVVVKFLGGTWAFSKPIVGSMSHFVGQGDK